MSERNIWQSRSAMLITVLMISSVAAVVVALIGIALHETPEAMIIGIIEAFLAPAIAVVIMMIFITIPRLVLS